MLYQLLHQNKHNPENVELMAQADITSIEEFGEWINEITRNHPLPDGWMWLCCNEKSRYFALANRIVPEEECRNQEGYSHD